MTLEDAAYALEEVAAGRVPDSDRAWGGYLSLGPLLLTGDREQTLHDAAATLELLVAVGGTAGLWAAGRGRVAAMAEAVRRLLDGG